MRSLLMFFVNQYFLQPHANDWISEAAHKLLKSGGQVRNIWCNRVVPRLNHLIKASVTLMKRVIRRIRKDKQKQITLWDAPAEYHFLCFTALLSYFHGCTMTALQTLFTITQKGRCLHYVETNNASECSSLYIWLIWFFYLSHWWNRQNKSVLNTKREHKG